MREKARRELQSDRQAFIIRAVMAVAAVAVVYFLVTGAIGALRAHELRQREERLREEVRQLQEEHRELEALRQYMLSDEFVELMARQQLGLVRKGEKGIVIVSPPPTPSATPGPGSETGPWWRGLLP